MAESMIGSLFGLSPEMYGEQQRVGAMNEGIALANLNPAARGAALTYAGAKGLGTAIGGAMGVQDPQLQLISARKAILGQIDQTNPSSLLKGAQTLAQMGDQQGAFALADYARKAQSEIALAQQRTEEKRTPEVRNALAYAGTVGEFGSPEFNRAYQQKLVELTSKEKPEATSTEMKNARAIALLEGPEGSPAYNTKYASELARLTTKAEGRPLIKEIGVAEGTREPVYTYQEGNNPPQQIIYKNINGQQQMIPYTGGVDRTTAKTSLGVKLPEGESEFVKQLAKKDADRVNDALTLRENASNAITSLNKLASLPDNQLITGQFATGRVGATNLLQTLGLASEKDAKKLASSQEYQKVAGDVILQTLGGKLGSGFSNADREFIASLVPQLETNPAARRQLISFMQAKNQDIVTETTRLENYARDKKGLGGFVPKIPMSVAPSQPRPYSGLSDAELDAKIRAAQQSNR